MTPCEYCGREGGHINLRGAWECAGCAAPRSPSASSWERSPVNWDMQEREVVEMGEVRTYGGGVYSFVKAVQNMGVTAAEASQAMQRFASVMGRL